MTDQGQPPPTWLTRFFGLERERRALALLLRRQRLVTLTGAGGSGKTRLASEVVRDLAPRFRGGVCWLDLAPLREPSTVRAAATGVLALGPDAASGLEAALAARLAKGAALLVLDNCEHLLNACAELAAELVASDSGLVVLSTSRQPLGVEGEAVRPLRTLRVPLRPAAGTPEDLGKHEATALLLDRVLLHDAGYRAGADDARRLAELCVRLDGLPLALELAAPWVAALGPDRLLERLKSGQELAALGRSEARHASLRVAMEWGHELLSAPERALFRRLSVFPGYLELDSVEAVCADAEVPAGEIATAFVGLVRKSLISLEEGRQQPLRRLHFAVRSFAMEKLDLTGERVDLERRFKSHYLDLAESIFASRHWADQARGIAKTEREYDNLQGAAQLLSAHEPESALQLLGGIGWAAFPIGRAAEMRELLEGQLAVTRSHTDAYARACSTAGINANAVGLFAIGRKRLEEAAALYEELGNVARTAFCLGMLSGSPDIDPQLKRQLLERSVSLAEEVGDKPSLALALANLGWLQLEGGEVDAGRPLVESAIEIFQELGENTLRTQMLDNLSVVLGERGERAAAVEAHRESLRGAVEGGLSALVPRFLETAALLAAAEGRPQAALRLAGAASAERVRFPAARPYPEPERLEGALVRARRAAGGRSRIFFREGQAMDLGAAVAYALGQSSPPSPKSSAGLSRRQQEVAAMVAQGLTDKQIARRLGISARTAEWHVQELRNRLGAVSRAEVAAWAAARGPGEVTPASQ